MPIFDPSRSVQALQQGSSILERKATSIAAQAVPWASGIIRFGAGFTTPRIEQAQGTKFSARYSTGNVVVEFATPHPGGDLYELYVTTLWPAIADADKQAKAFAVTRAGFWLNMYAVGTATYFDPATTTNAALCFRVMR